MKKLIAFVFFILIFILPIYSQSYNFINGAWGYENCLNEICGDLETPSELYWVDNQLSVCIVQNGEYFSKNFIINETIDNSSFKTVDYLLTTDNGYVIHLNGYVQSNKSIVLLNVQIYSNGFLISILNEPLL